MLKTTRITLYRIATLLIGAVLTIATATAHHTWITQYDADTVIVLEGKIAELKLMSPHSRIMIEVIGENGEPEIWTGETWPLAQLYRRGITYDSVSVGDTVLVTGEVATKGRKGLHLRTLYRPSDDFRVWIGLKADTGENSADGIGEGINRSQIDRELE